MKPFLSTLSLLLLTLSNNPDLFSQAAQRNIPSSNGTRCYSDSIERLNLNKEMSEILKGHNYSEEERKVMLLRKIEISECLYNEQKYQETLDWLENIDDILNLPEFSKFNLELFNLLSFKGKAAKKLNRWVDAYANFEKALTIINNNPNVIKKDQQVEIYFNFGIANVSLDDPIQALDYLNKAIAVCFETNSCSQKRLGQIYSYIGKCYMFLGNKDMSLAQFEKAISIFHAHSTSVSKEKEVMIDIIHEKGRMHNFFDEYNEAVQCFKGSKKLCEEIFGYYHKKTAYTIDVLGNAYYYLNDYPAAITEFKKAIEIFRAIGDQKSAALADKYSKIAACHTNLKEFKAANSYMDSCFEVLNFNWRIGSPFEEYKSSLTHLLITLYFKAKNHQKAYEAGWGKEELYKAAHWFDLCIELIEYINSTFEESGSKKYLLDRFYYVFEAAINSNYFLYQETDSLQYIERAFGYAERSKALLLKEAMQMADANVELGIPKELLDEERRLKKAIIDKENQRYELQQAQEEERAPHHINSEIFTLKQAYRNLMDSIQQQYPKAHRLRYASGPMTPAQVQKELLAPGQALVQYFLGEEHLFLFVIGPEKVVLAKRPVEKGLPDAIRGFRESIYSWSQSQEDSLAQQYAGYGYQLYQSLVQPIAPFLPEHLIIIPDGLLEYVPFEALLQEPASPESLTFDAYPYLIRKYRISYAHSARLLQEMRTSDYEAPRQWILAFAPSFKDPPNQENSLVSRRRNLGRLTSNVKEVQSIKTLLRTRIYKGTDATRERFLADAPHYGIIHLATHAKANDEEGEYSYLAFAEIPDTIQNELLYAKDLYSMRLQADMVVLSACESGIGELRRGEGVISLARGFSYAGAKSLVTTLWRVSDRESAALMQLFYQHLKEGKAKDEALRAAKMQFISRPGAAQAHPFFWAAFILSGDITPIEVNGQTFPAWGYVLLIGLFVFLALRFAKRKTS